MRRDGSNALGFIHENGCLDLKPNEGIARLDHANYEIINNIRKLKARSAYTEILNSRTS